MENHATIKHDVYKEALIMQGDAANKIVTTAAHKSKNVVWAQLFYLPTDIFI